MAHRKRLRRINEPGHAHALTFSCFRRQPFLNRDRSRQWLLKAIDVARTRHRYHVWAYVLMPEHAHVLVWPTEHDYDVSAFLASVKTSVSRTALAYVRKNAPAFLPRMLDQQPNGDCRYRFWQRGGGYDRNVIEPKTAWREIDYYHANPVRRGLCVRPTEWPWSSAATYAVLTNGPRRLDRESLPRTPEGGGRPLIDKERRAMPSRPLRAGWACGCRVRVRSDENGPSTISPLIPRPHAHPPAA